MKNVRDEWQDKSDDEIKTLRNTCPLVVVTENTGDFNKSNILRTAEFFGASEFWIVGSKRWDRRGAVGAQHRLEVKYFPTWDMCFNHIDGRFENAGKGYNYFDRVALEQSDHGMALDEFYWGRNTILFVGEEGNGLSYEVLDRMDFVVEIPAFGAVRSLNVASAAAIAINSYRMGVENRG